MNFVKNAWKSMFKKQQTTTKAEDKTEDNTGMKEEEQQIPYEILEELFNLSSQLIKKSNVTDNNVKLKIYGLYKQGTQGDCNIPQPQMFDFVGKSKWNAWNDLKGMKKTQAMAQYIKAVNEVDPSIGKKISQHLEQGTESGKSEQKQQVEKQNQSQSAVGYKKVQAVDYSDTYSHPYFKSIEKGDDIENISHDRLLEKNNEPTVYPLHFAIDKERVDLVGKFLDLLTPQQVQQMKDAEGTGILEYAQLIQNEQILEMVKNKLIK